MNIVYPLRDYCRNIKDKKKQLVYWNVLKAHPDFNKYGFELLDPPDVLQSKLLATHKSESGSVAPKPEWMELMIERVSEAQWKSMQVACRKGEEIRKSWYDAIYPDPNEVVSVPSFVSYVPETSKELLIRWLVTKRIDYNYLFL